jgi:hypothetical protein
MGSTLRMSVIVLAYGPTAVLAGLLASLVRQTVARDLELVLVLPQGCRLQGSDLAVAGLGAWRIVTGRSGDRLGDLKAQGVRNAQAPLAAFLEEHSRPEPTWAEALLAAHGSGRWDVVGPQVHLASPGRPLAWATQLLLYGGSLGPPAQGRPPTLPGNHSCYRRDLLLAQEERLGQVLEFENLFFDHLAGRGGRLRLEPSARVGHLACARLRPMLREIF